MNKLAKLIQELNYEDAQLLKKDLEHGNINKLLKKRIEEARRERLSLCPVCNSPVQEGLGLYLEFGRPDFRKKATFDTPQCLQYFVQNSLVPKPR